LHSRYGFFNGREAVLPLEAAVGYNGSMDDSRADAGDSLCKRLADWLGETVVVDCVSPYLAIGRLVAAGTDYLELEDADLHDLRDTDTTRELYVVKTARHGVSPNRTRLLLRLGEVVGITRLEDVETA
jgi:hypothetical protein